MKTSPLTAGACVRGLRGGGLGWGGLGWSSLWWSNGCSRLGRSRRILGQHALPQTCHRERSAREMVAWLTGNQCAAGGLAGAAVLRRQLTEQPCRLSGCDGPL